MLSTRCAMRCSTTPNRWAGLTSIKTTRPPLPTSALGVAASEGLVPVRRGDSSVHRPGDRHPQRSLGGGLSGFVRDVVPVSDRLMDLVGLTGVRRADPGY